MSLGPTVSVYKIVPNIDEAKVLYSFNNVPIGSLDQTGSGAFDVRGYSEKTIYGYIGILVQSSGSIVVSGSFDNSIWFQYVKSTVFNSGSTGSTITITDALPYIKANLRNEEDVAVSGSLYLAVKY